MLVKISLLFGFVLTVTYNQVFLTAPYCYKTLGNHFRKFIPSIKVISINSIIRIYQFHRNGLFGAYLLNTPFRDEPPSKVIIYLNL